jgi:hypothetical protein
MSKRIKEEYLSHSFIHYHFVKYSSSFLFSPFLHTLFIGKSGASFYRTDDERFILKTLSRFELDSLKNCALKYINYVSEATLEHKLTCLSKIFGAYAISYTNKQNGQIIKHDYLVMEYLFYQKV